MEPIELLYDHYKETVKTSVDMQAKRNALFVYVCVVEILNFIMLLFPQVISSIVTAYVAEVYKVSVVELIQLLPTVIWIITAYVLVRYYQSTIYVERQYPYIKELETEISKRAHLDCFEREGKGYLKKYPLVLDLIHVFYTWMIPILLLIINMLKIYLEWKNTTNWIVIAVNTAICGFVLVLSTLFLWFMHPAKKSSKKVKHKG